MGATYLYAIARSKTSVPLVPTGLPDGRAPLRNVSVGDLVALVSDYHGPSPRDLPRSELLRLLSIHQKAIEAAMSGGSVLPAKLGTIVSSDSEVHATLTRFQDALLAALDRVGDGVEIEVAATWDLASTFSEVGKEPHISSLVIQAATLPADQTHAMRVQVGELVKQALDLRRAEYRSTVLAALRPTVVDAQANVLLADELVLNVAFLVERRNLDIFYNAVHRVDDQLHGRLNFRCVGPLPPYSFATVSLYRPDPAALDHARRLFDLADTFSEADITTNYRRLAAGCHPDRNPNDPTAAARFAALSAANECLLSYCRLCRVNEDRAGGERHRYLAPLAAGSLPALQILRSNSEPFCAERWESSYEYKSVVA